MSLEIEFTNSPMNLNIWHEKAITSESLLIERKFLEEVQNKIVQIEEIYLFGVMLFKRKGLFGFLLMTKKKF